MTRKYNIGDRVTTPVGAGEIECLPYNDESTTYAVWLDRPFARGTHLEHFLAIDEEKIKPEKNNK